MNANWWMGVAMITAVAAAGCATGHPGDYHGPAPAPQARVQICDGDGNCYVFDGPPCSDWGLAGGSCCDDIPEGRVAVTGGNSNQGPLSVDYVDSTVVVRARNGRIEKTVLDLSALAENAILGVNARVAAMPDAPAAARGQSPVALDVVVKLLDKLTRSEIERRNWLIDISHLETVTTLRAEAGDGPRRCGKGLYPPNCYPCLGCEPCPGNPSEYCDTVWNSISLPRVHPEAESAGFRFCEGRMTGGGQ